MKTHSKRIIGTLVALLSLMAVLVVVSALLDLPVLTAIPIGLLFGFFLERSDLCGSSAFSEVLLMKDPRKMIGLWAIIVTSMLFFAFGSKLGWVELNPKPFLWTSYLAGGALFGAGMVLAGGCVSGTLFKAGQGNLNSMAALVAIPIGIAAVEYGPLHGIHQSLKSHVLTNTDGGSVTLTSLTGAPYWLLALMIAAVTLLISLFLHRRSKTESATNLKKSDGESLLMRLLSRSWKPWQSGIAIGILALAAYTSSAASGRNYPLGVTHGVLHVGLLATESPVKHVWKKQPGEAALPQKTAGNPPKKVSWWLIALVTMLVMGSHVSARLRGSFKLVPKPPDETIVAFLGGLMVGAGAALAGGCIVGNIMSGVALMSVGNMFFAVVVAIANWITTLLYMKGLRG